MKPVRVAVVGLGFGAEFVPIYQAWRDTECVAVCRRDAEKLNRFADRFGVPKRYTDFHAMLQDPEIDAVHINSDLQSHAWMTIEAMKAGKHVASTITMAMTEEECAEIVRLEESTGKVYMMMETSIYTREFLYFKQLYERGEAGRLQFMRGSHHQNMSMPGWPTYWYGLPPMWYSSHAVAPLSEILRKPVCRVQCVGSGHIDAEYAGEYGSPFAAESAHLTFRDTDVRGEVTRTLFSTVRQYCETFDFYCSKTSFEWERCAGENPVIFTGFEDAEHFKVPDTDVLLPGEIGRFALKNQTVDPDQLSFIQGSDHGGSHPHLVVEWIRAIQENRKARVHARVAANWTMTGLLAHESAMRGGVAIDIPEWAQF